MKKLTLIFLFTSLLFAAESQKLLSGSGLYWAEDAETRGKGNILASLSARGFYWDNPNQNRGIILIPKIWGEYGILPWLDVSVQSEFISYRYTVPGDFKLRVKATLPFENKLQWWNVGALLKYSYNFVDQFSGNGYRNEEVGWDPEGLRYIGHEMEWRLLGDVEIMMIKSFLPMKFYLNFGGRFSPGGGHLTPSPSSNAYQHLFGVGLEYKTLTADFFLEYGFEALNDFSSLKTVNFKKPTEPETKKFPYYFSENPIQLTPGFRMKYPNGANFLIAFPILLSKEKGYDLGSLTTDEKVAYQYKWTDGFSPFFTNWKITGTLTYPIRYNAVNAEIIRKFMLLKGQPEKKTIDIDEKLKSGNEAPVNEEEKLQQELEKKRQEMLNNNLLE